MPGSSISLPPCTSALETTSLPPQTQQRPPWGATERRARPPREAAPTAVARHSPPLPRRPPRSLSQPCAPLSLQYAVAELGESPGGHRDPRPDLGGDHHHAHAHARALLCPHRFLPACAWSRGADRSRRGTQTCCCSRWSRHRRLRGTDPGRSALLLPVLFLVLVLVLVPEPWCTETGHVLNA
jgi:hypothetical protein